MVTISYAIDYKISKYILARVNMILWTLFQFIFLCLHNHKKKNTFVQNSQEDFFYTSFSLKTQHIQANYSNAYYSGEKKSCHSKHSKKWQGLWSDLLAPLRGITENWPTKVLSNFKKRYIYGFFLQGQKCNYKILQQTQFELFFGSKPPLFKSI